MAGPSGTSEGFVVLPEIVCRAIPEPTTAAALEARQADLRGLTSTQLIDLVHSRNGTLSQADLPTIMSIAQERLAASQADTDIADQLLQICRKLGKNEAP
jgi:hypothetical protein